LQEQEVVVLMLHLEDLEEAEMQEVLHHFHLVVLLQSLLVEMELQILVVEAVEVQALHLVLAQAVLV
jgi:hypothetical protein